MNLHLAGIYSDHHIGQVVRLKDITAQVGVLLILLTEFLTSSIFDANEFQSDEVREFPPIFHHNQETYQYAI